MNTPSDWDDILEQDEVIRWQGRPDSTVKWLWPHFVSLALGLVISLFALLWMLAAAKQGGLLWTFGLLFVAIGLSLILGPPYLRPYIRSRTWYTLTNKRALIATDLPLKGRKVEAYPINTEAPLQLDPRYGTSVYFATVMRRSRNGAYKMKIGFERIENAEQVYNLMCEIQKENT